MNEEIDQQKYYFRINTNDFGVYIYNSDKVLIIEQLKNPFVYNGFFASYGEAKAYATTIISSMGFASEEMV